MAARLRPGELSGCGDKVTVRAPGRPGARGGAPAEIGDPLAAIEGGRPFDAVVAAGGGPVRQLAGAARYRHRLVTRATDLLDALDRGPPSRLAGDAAAASGAVLCHSEDLRGRLEHRLPACRGRTVHWPADPPPLLVRRLLGALAPVAPAALGTRRLRVLFAGPAFNFIDAVAARLARLEQCEVRLERWWDIGARPTAANRAANDWADVVVCEWTGANAVWHSRNKRPGQRLIVRLHRFEKDTRWPRAVDWTAVDQLVAVSPAYRDLLRGELPGVRAARVVAIPNYVDPLALEREKTPGARFHLGLLGAVPKRKRLDLAFDLLAELRRRDPRYRLFVKGAMPRERAAWRRRDERAYYRRVFRRARRDRALRGAVDFEPFGPDVGHWLRKIGVILSTSDSEGSHVAVAEGMLSGATGVVLRWPGADGVYGAPWVVGDTTDGAERILAESDPEAWERAGRAARRHARRYALDRVFDAWARLLVADRDPAAWVEEAPR